MLRRIVFPSALVLLTTLPAAQPQESNQGTLRLISGLPDYIQPSGLIEASPGLFLSVGQPPGGGEAVFSVTAKGATNTLTSFPSGYNLSGFPVGGPNGRFYDGVGYHSNSGNMFSVSTVPGVKEYSTQTFVPFLSQAIPDGMLLGAGVGPTGWNLATCNKDGVVTSVYSFPSGDFVEQPVVYATDGNYYGIDLTATGGYVYQSTPSGSLAKLHTFPNGAFIGSSPAPLLQASDGNLYGAALYDGANRTGTIYSVSLAGQYSVVYTFPKGPAGFPTSLIQASDGNLYGTTLGNTQASKGHSVMFRLTTSGQYTQLYAWPYSVCQCYLVQGSDGNIYGIGQQGGGFFVWEGGLPKPAPQAPSFTPSSGAAGTQVLIWGYNLLSPSVSFNGVAAAKVTGSGPQYIRATVPAGATTGPITVTTPGGTYTTTTSFTVQ